MVRGAQEDAAQAHEVARDREIDHLPAAVGQQLVRARPALLQDERVVTLLALVDDLGVRRDRPPPRLEFGEARELVGLSGRNRFSFWTRALATDAIGSSYHGRRASEPQASNKGRRRRRLLL